MAEAVVSSRMEIVVRRARLSVSALAFLFFSALTAATSQRDDLQTLCKNVWGVRADETNLKNVPASLPPPPAGARRCGARESFKSIYYVWAVPDAEILTYWETELKRNGFRTQRVGGSAPGRESLDFAGPIRGKISLSRRGGGFVLVAGPS